MSESQYPERFLYLAGTSFTGSTLLSFLLNLHPEMVSVGECDPNFSRWPDRREYPCSCGRTLAECPFWTAVGEEMGKRGLRFGPEQWDMSFSPDHALGHRALTTSLHSTRAENLRDAVAWRLPGVGGRIRSAAARNEALAASACAVTGKPVFVDATKNVSRARWLERATNLEPFVVHLVRDSLGFVASKKSRAEANRGGADVGDATRHWNRKSEEIERLFATLPPERRLRVRYEDLCTDPEREMGRICSFAGVTSVPGPYDFRAGDHHVIGNRMRLSSSSEIRLDERWRSILSDEEAETVRRDTSRYRREFGYA